MDEVIEKEMQEIIKKNLPAQVGETLRKRLELADKESEELKRLKIRVAETDGIVKTLEGRVLKEEEIVKREQDLDIRSEELDKKAQKMEVEILNVKLTESEKRADMVQGFTSSLVRNTIVRKRILDTEDVGGTPIVDGHGVTHYPLPSSKDHTETKEEE